jgi:hypothetical protein
LGVPILCLVRTWNLSTGEFLIAPDILERFDPKVEAKSGAVLDWSIDLFRFLVVDDYVNK